MDLSLIGKRALVCGSSGGIGEAIAKLYADQGAEVILFARNKEKLHTVCSALSKSENQNHQFIVADFDQPKQVESVLISFQQKDPKPIHIVVHNSGGPPLGPLPEASADDLRIAFNRLLVSAQLISRLLIEGMRKEAYGRIINVISTSVKEPLHGFGVSNTIRAAVANWGKTMSNELAKDGITVNNLLPGSTATDRMTEIIGFRAKKRGVTFNEVMEEMKASIPAGRLASPEEIANAAAFLASPAASYITGINLPVDGGRTRSH